MAYCATYKPNELGELQKVVINAGVGFVLPFYGEVAPPGTLACDGSEVSREAYSELFAVLGTKAGAGDGSTTFNLPDFRGDFIRCVGGNAAELGVEQEDAIRNFNGILHNMVFDGMSDGVKVEGIFQKGSTSGIRRYYQALTTGECYYRQSILCYASGSVPTATENRPVNVALLWCIIYE